MKATLTLTKNCKLVDKYEVVNEKGEVITDNPPVSPAYFPKETFGGAKTLVLSVEVKK